MCSLSTKGWTLCEGVLKTVSLLAQTPGPATRCTGQDLHLERAGKSAEGCGWAFLYHNPFTLHPSPCSRPWEPTMGYINDPLVLWLQPMKGPSRNQKTGENEACVPRPLFPSLHLHLRLAVSFYFPRWLPFQVPVTISPFSLGPKSDNSSVTSAPTRRNRSWLPYTHTSVHKLSSKCSVVTEPPVFSRNVGKGH